MDAPNLIQSCPTCGASIDVSEEYPLATIACPACGTEALVDGRVDYFELQEIVGRGGVGVVYKAYDASLDRFVALKLLRLDKTSDEAVVQQMATEAAVTASINHPHVVRVFTTGTDRGRFFIAMELVDKGTLDQLIQLQGQVAEAQVLEVGVQIAQGLRAAQQAGLIHRDVKPGNILFADAHTAKIVDFGLAIFMEDEEKARGEVWGTPYYVAPEKLNHQREDFRSDIYSLGGTLFHALAGRPPFEDEDASMVALKHLKSQAVSLQAFAPHVSSQTAYVINRTLAKDPNDRYQSYDELIEHLQFAREQLRQNAARPPQQKRVVMEDEESQQMIGWIVMALAGLLILGGIGALIFRNQIFGRSAPKSTPAAAGAAATAAPAAKAGPLFADALDKLADGDAEGALALYRKHINNPKYTPYELAWANFGEAAAALAAGKSEDARKAFRAVNNRAPYSTSAADEKTITFLEDTARRLAGDRPINPDEAKKLNPKNYESLAVLLSALQKFNQGRADEALALFRQFRHKTAPEGRDEWIRRLQPLAGQFIDFEEGAAQLKKAQNPEQRRDALKVLRKIKGPLAARVADLEKAAEPVVPTSASNPQEWRYTTQNPGADWMRLEFNDAGWQKGRAPFGNQLGGTNTNWTGADIWLRREVTLPAKLPANLAFEIFCDDEATIFINGVPAGARKQYTKEYVSEPMTPQGRAALKPGKNIIAVHCHQGAGAQFIDVGIVAAAR